MRGDFPVAGIDETGRRIGQRGRLRLPQRIVDCGDSTGAIALVVADAENLNVIVGELRVVDLEANGPPLLHADVGCVALQVASPMPLMAQSLDGLPGSRFSCTMKFVPAGTSRAFQRFQLEPQPTGLGIASLFVAIR